MEINVVQKKGTKSVVLNYFGLRADENGMVLQTMEDNPVCRKCNKRIRAKSRNMSNLFIHLHDNHPAEYADACKLVQSSKGESSRQLQRQPTLYDTIQRCTTYDRKSREAAELNRAVAYFLAKDMQPLYTAEKSGFKNLISKLNP